MNTPKIIVNESKDKVNRFDAVKRAYEADVATGRDTGKSLMTLAEVIAYSVLKKCLDPRSRVGDIINGREDEDKVGKARYNTDMVKLRRGLTADLHLIANTVNAVNHATEMTFTADGDPEEAVVDKDMQEAAVALLRECMTDGIDLLQEAAVAILEQTAEHASGGEWLDAGYIVKRPARQVTVRKSDKSLWKEEVTTPMREAFRAVRRAIENARTVKADPRSKYFYLEDIATDEDGDEMRIYRRGRALFDLSTDDIGGGLYTTSEDVFNRVEALVERMELTDRQEAVLLKRLQGKTNNQIAEETGRSVNSVKGSRHAIEEAAYSIGLYPDGVTPKKFRH